MRILKKIGLFILALIGLILIVAVFVNKEYAVERNIVINKPPQAVFNYVKYIKNQDYFHTWAMLDTNCRREYKGVDGTKGYNVAWDSDNSDVGKGEQQITNIEEGKRIDYGLRFIEPFEGNATAYMTTAPQNNQTVVTWGMNGETNYPMNLMNLFMDRMLGGDMESSLQRLKVNVEK